MICAEARVYTGACADGEMELVPAAAVDHVAACDECTREVDWQRAGNLAVAGALSQEAAMDSSAAAANTVESLPGGTRRWRPGALIAAAAAAMVLVSVGVGAVLISPNRFDAAPAPEGAMADAVHIFGTPADYSGDSVAVNGWAGAHGAAMPVMSIAGAACVGARAGTVAGRQAVTYLYREGASPVELSPIPGEAPMSWPTSETRMMNGIAVGMVHHGNQGLIVVADDESALMQFISQIQ
ncbi:MAG: hypothetical protein WBD38_06715 [Candidatus Dormiibacterota bacterium]